MPIFKNKTTFTSEQFSTPKTTSALTELYVAVTGNGPVYIEQRGEDGDWRYFPETTFTTTTAQRVTIRKGRFRIRIAAAAATTVEVDW